MNYYHPGMESHTNPINFQYITQANTPPENPELSGSTTHVQEQQLEELEQSEQLEQLEQLKQLEELEQLKQLEELKQLEQRSWYPRVLVIGPGGAKGLKVLGFLSVIEDSGLLNYVDTYCGVSIGAVISLLIICGYEIREIVGEAARLDIFKDIGSFNLQSVMEHHGLISNEPVRKILTQLVINKLGNVPSLYSLYMRTGKAFTAVTLNATDEKCEMMNPFTYPGVSCVDATMFSMNIPFVFYQIIHHGKTYVDGALANPYPVDYFDDGETNILGIYMKTTHKIQTIITPHISGGIIHRVEESSTPLSIGSYSLKIVHSLMDQRRNHIIQQSSSHCKHVRLETKIGDTTGYTLTTEDKALMLVEGFNEGKAFLSQLDTNTYTGPNIPDKLAYTYPPYYTMGESETIEVLSAMNS
jgi:predicted acylesterase/phospholipase RssA